MQALVEKLSILSQLAFGNIYLKACLQPTKQLSCIKKFPRENRFSFEELMRESSIIIIIIIIMMMIIIIIMVTQHIPTMTKSHHGGDMSELIKVGRLSISW